MAFFFVFIAQSEWKPFIESDAVSPINTQEKEKEQEKLVAIANRKRSSRIVVKEFELQEKARLEAIRQQELQAVMDQRKKDIQQRRLDRVRFIFETGAISTLLSIDAHICRHELVKFRLGETPAGTSS
jgi:hypothetical protein